MQQPTPIVVAPSEMIEAIKDDRFLRMCALDRALQQRITDSAVNVVAAAQEMYEFLRGSQLAAAEQAATPRPTRSRKKAEAAEPAAPAATSESSAPAKAENVATDVFGAPSAAAASPTPETAPAEAPSKPSSDKATIEQVREALVKVQTFLKSKDKAVDILAKFTVGNERTLAKLQQEKYDAVIAACEAAIVASTPA